VDNLRQSVRLDVRLAVNEVERARQQISASKVTRRLEEQALRAEKEMFDVGSSTALLVAQAQRDLLASRIAEVRAVVNYRIALVRLYLAEGSLLERRGVRIGPRGDAEGAEDLGGALSALEESKEQGDSRSKSKSGSRSE
jgi:outer membrane protein TolC